LDVLSYNVHGLPAPIAGDDPEGRMPQIQPLLPPYAIVGIQEVWVDSYYEALLGDAARETAVRFDLRLDDSRFYGSGLAVFSDLIEVSHHHQHYTTCNGALDGASDCLASKGFQRVTLLLGTWGEEPIEVDVWNTHFEAGGGDADIEARAAHVDDLVTAMIEQSAGRAMIFTADQNLSPWNDPEDVEPYARLTDEVGLSDACALLECDDPDHIDKVMIRGGDRVELTAEAWAVPAEFFDAEGERLSDHPAISARVRWSIVTDLERVDADIADY
jgi:hypothetical protein